jgi:hypothetical protein
MEQQPGDWPIPGKHKLHFKSMTEDDEVERFPILLHMFCNN